MQLRGDCVVKGNLYAGKLQVEPTAIFNGQCHMGAAANATIAEGNNVVEMSKNGQPQAVANIIAIKNYFAMQGLAHRLLVAIGLALFAGLKAG